jgi:GT2 family glycosyltransferase/glycosyltransferase involved in cell wall biosynthesis
MIRHITSDNITRLWKTLTREGFGSALVKTRNYIKKNRALKKEVHEPVDSMLATIFTGMALPVPPVVPDVSIIIPVFNNWVYTYNCILSIPLSCQKFSYEIIIADDGSDDETLTAGKIFNNVIIIRDGINRRFLKNCNNAAISAKGRYLYFLNNDTKLLKGAIDELVEYQENNERVGITGSKLIYPDGSLQEAGGIIWADGSAWNYGRFHNRDAPEYNFVREVDYVSGASLLIRTSLWRSLKGFDESFSPAYCEDSDLCMQARLAGYSTYYIPKSVVIHYEGKSNGTNIAEGQKRFQVINTKRLVGKWNETLTGQHYSIKEMSFLARNRSTLHNPIVLVIDHYVPQYDRDAGSRSMWSYIMNINVTGAVVVFIGDNFAALEPYTSELQSQGVEVLHGKRYSEHWEEWIAENGQFIDLVLLSRPHIAPKYLPALRKFSSAKIVYYGHDLHYLREMRRVEITGIEGAHTIQEIKDDEIGLMSQMDVVISCSLDEVCLLKNDLPGKDIRYVPIYSVESIKLGDLAHKNGLLFVGSFGHPPNADGLLWFLQDIFPLILQLDPSIVLHIVGSNPPKGILSFSSNSVIIHGRVSDLELQSLYGTSKVCIIPLRYGAGVKGKLVEAMAYGLPVVTTPIGIEGLPHIMRRCALVSRTESDFAGSVVRLYDDPKLRCRLIELGYRSIRKWFSSDVMKQFWTGLICELVPNIPTMKKWNMGYNDLKTIRAKICPVIKSLSHGKFIPKIIHQPIGYYEDGWCAPYFSIDLGMESNEPITVFIEIWVPEQMPGSVRIVSLINGSNEMVTYSPIGVSTIMIENVHPINCHLSVSLKSENWNRESLGSIDSRELSFILRKIEL